MIRYRNRPMRLGLALALAAAMLAGSASPAVADEEQTRTVTRHEFSESTTLADAEIIISTIAAKDQDIVTYQYQNGPVVGEFNSNAGMTLEEFASQYQRMYGVAAAVTAVLTTRDDTRSQRSPEITPSDGTDHVSTVIVTEYVDTSKFAIQSEIPSTTTLEQVTGVVELEAGASAKTAATGDAWQPEYVNAGTWRSGSYQYFRMNSKWEYGHAADQVPSGFGIEFGIDLYNSSYGGSRPNCPYGYKDAFLAKNHSWPSWQLVVPGWTPSAGDAQVYADYNDLLDACNRNSFALGVRYPDRLPMIYAANQPDVSMLIQAPIGTTSSSKIGANIQLVDNGYCDSYPWMALTDCMGVLQSVPPGQGSRAVLSASRDWYAEPHVCWVSPDYGLEPPAVVFC